jgi:hypothetical protein
MSIAPFTHFVFVDFENVSEVDLGLIEGRPVHVTLLLGKNQTKLGLPLVQQIRRMTAQVELIEVGASGRNALDLTLAFYLGQAVQSSPTTGFHIVSKDKDFDAMLGHLVANGIKAARCDAFRLLSFLPRAKPAVAAKNPSSSKAATAGARTLDDRCAKVIARLANPASRNRPATERALRAHIKTALGKESSTAKIDDVVRRLQEHGLTIEGGKVVFTTR